MRIVKYNNNNVFPSLMNEFFNDDFGLNFFNRNYSVPSVNSIENNDSFNNIFYLALKSSNFKIWRIFSSIFNYIISGNIVILLFFKQKNL